MLYFCARGNSARETNKNGNIMNTKSSYCAKCNVRIQKRFDELIKDNELSMFDIYFKLSEEFDLSTDRISEIIHKRRI